MVIVISYSNVWVVRSIIRFDGARLSYALVRSNCNKLVITWPLGRLTDLSPSGALRPRVINQPAPSWPCYNYYLYPQVMKGSVYYSEVIFGIYIQFTPVISKHMLHKMASRCKTTVFE